MQAISSLDLKSCTMRIGPNGDSEKDGYRLFIADLDPNCSQKELERKFGKYGQIRTTWIARTSPCYAFVVYERFTDAEDAIEGMSGQ